jgi:hypothetical protein
VANAPKPKTITADHLETSAEGQAAKAEAEANAPGAAEVQSAMDKATERGFIGNEVDTTPNEHYTVAGVLAGKPTPETDPQAAAKASADNA